MDGEWEAVDTDLEVREDGSVGPRAATAQLNFSGGGDGPLVELERSGRELALVWPEELPEPELAGDTALYRDVLPDVDLRLTAQPDGFSQLIVVNSAEAAANSALSELRLGLASSGVDPQVTESGGIEALDENADTAVFEAPVPLMWDSSGGTEAATLATADDEAAVGPPGAGESANMAHVGADINDEQDALTLTPDQDVLLGEDTVYPVYIDPQWHSPRSTAWTMVSRYWASSPQWKFNGSSNAGMGYCGWATCMPQDVKRLMYRIPVSTFSDARIIEATFSVRNVHSATCTPQAVELWRTAGINANTTWNSQDNGSFWIERLETETFSYGYDGCGAAQAEFDVRDAVQDAADDGRSTLTFGLQAADETEPLSWKRFSDRAHLTVLYNRVPDQIEPSQLVMSRGGACRPASNPAYVHTLGDIFADPVTDPDGGALSVEFAARWDAGDGRGNIVRWESGRVGPRDSGSYFDVPLPDDLPEGVVIEWFARSYDGYAYSPWSYRGNGNHACHFVYDLSVPSGPEVSSAHYPSITPGQASPWYQGAGHYGEFTFSSSDTDVVAYVYRLDDGPQQRIATTGGAPRTVDLVPDAPGPHRLYVIAEDAARYSSEEVTYQFRAAAGAPARGRWQFDETSSASSASATVPTRWATVSGGTTLGVAGAVGTGIRFDGTSGYARTTLPVIDTDRAFSVSAWVRLDHKPTSAAVVATQAGTHQPGFELYYSATQDSWAFNQYRYDREGETSTARVLASGVDVVAGEWAHLVGSYDPGGDLLRLFVNGRLAGSTSYAEAWNARGFLQIGAGQTSGQPRSFFPGTIDEVQVFDLYMASETSHIARLYNKERLHTSGRPAVALMALDERAGSQRVSAAPDVLPVSFHGGAQAGVPGVHSRALQLNGTDGYASTGTAMVNTERSFAVSAWARLDRTPQGAAVVATQTGTLAPGFELYYSSAYNRWAFNQYSDNTADAQPVRVMQPDGQTAQVGEWVHLVGVHDAYEQTLRLYVDGEDVGFVTLDTPFHANQAIQIGAGQSSGALRSFFPGTIDDVRVFDRILTTYEVQQIYHQAPIVRARWQLDDLSTGSPASSPDATTYGNDLFLWGGAGVSPGFVDEASLYVDGGGGYAYAPDVPIDTAGSFTVTAFARAASPPAAAASVLSAVGQRESAFAVRFEPDSEQEGFGRWQVTLSDRDDSTATTTRVGHSRLYDVREWHHLALVYDAFAAEARLYVDGALEEVTCLDSEETNCAPSDSRAGDVFPFAAQSSLHVGRSMTGGVWREPWPGAVDDVWAIQGVLTDDQIAQLSLGPRDAATEVPPQPEQSDS
ncbi:LamG-like jellyroll fold domain-containing protein [Streptomyces millisiae]|uniref:LamG-like jellyroll fold domain-containing protein n=1 Tax=Streptomyces millisiae TaxID=3075542 RepID=A0ABU2LLW6_9ACTN|nr:LamG-like jellyroll fold domain-containing protein [Streptomyces sp. DSM 44918]MDT0318577.1 LamG-like jellyroll fold domain-containing protein [Streptomyces sp. DSM 44918]